MLVTRKILFKQLGENSTTPRDPVGVVTDESKVDLEATTTCCLSFDDNRLVPKKLYSIGEVTLPDWLDPEEWLHDQTAWKWLWGLGADPNWPEAWQRGLLRLGSSANRLAAIKLLRVKKFRSEFRKSLRGQLETWLETPREDRQYDSPFSFRQWDCLVNRHVAIEAKQRDAGLYHGGLVDASVAA
jgi:hypothetical protein